MTVLANLLNTIKNAERAAKREVYIKQVSNLSTQVLKKLQENGYIGEFEIIDDKRGKVYRVQLTHTINNCGVISPRFPVSHKEIEPWEKKFLPAQGMGVMLLSTSKGLLTHEEAKKKGIGGKLIAFVY